MDENQFRILIKSLNEIGLGKSANPEGFGAIEHLGMVLVEKLGEICEHLNRIANVLEEKK